MLKREQQLNSYFYRCPLCIGDTNKNMKNTREIDLGSLEEGVARAESKEGRTHRKAILEDIYEQLKDSFLEKMRWQLIDALKKNDIIKFNEIRKKVEDYARSPVFVRKRIKARARINQKEAEQFIRKEVI